MTPSDDVPPAGRTMVLQEVRKAAGETQAVVAGRLGIRQPNVAAIERRGDMLLSTLRSYVEALGGSVTLSVQMPGLPHLKLDGLGEQARGRRARQSVTV